MENREGGSTSLVQLPRFRGAVILRASGGRVVAAGSGRGPTAAADIIHVAFMILHFDILCVLFLSYFAALKFLI